MTGGQVALIGIVVVVIGLGAKYLVFVFSRSVKMRASSAFSVCILFEESVFIFQLLNNKMQSYVSLT